MEGACHPGYIRPEVGEEGSQTAEVDHRVEGQALVWPPKKTRDQDQVAGGGDREKLGETLNNAQHHALGIGHEAD